MTRTSNATCRVVASDLDEVTYEVKELAGSLWATSEKVAAGRDLTEHDRHALSQGVDVLTGQTQALRFVTQAAGRPSDPKAAFSTTQTFFTTLLIKAAAQLGRSDISEKPADGAERLASALKSIASFDQPDEARRLAADYEALLRRVSVLAGQISTGSAVSA